MRIGVDLRVLASGRRTGVEEYTLGLLDALLPLGSNHRWLLFYNAWRKRPFSFRWGELPWVEIVESRFPNRPLMCTAAYTGLPTANWFLGDIDLFFAPHFFPIGVSGATKLVVTFHDLSFERHPELLSVKKRWWHQLSAPWRQARRAEHVITVSESSKRDLVTFYHLPPERISVIHSGVASAFRPLARTHPRLAAVRSRYRLPERFILYFGTIEPRKNIAGLIEAFRRSALPARGIALVIAGTLGWSYKEILRLARQSSAQARIHFTGFIAPDDKPYLLNLAEAFVYPSFFEGFGFPPLEAMACGVQVITSRSSSLPEVVGTGALLVDPANVAEMRWALERVSEEETLREYYRQKGLIQARRFSWEKAALSTLGVLESVV